MRGLRLLAFKVAVVAALATMVPAGAKAALDLVKGSPDIVSNGLSYVYDVSQELLTISGSLSAGWELEAEGMTYPIIDGVFTATANITSAGNLGPNVPPGTIEILGAIPTLPPSLGGPIPNQVVLLQGTLVEFGAMGSSGTGDDILEFVWKSLSGQLAPIYGKAAGTIGTSTGYPGTFANDWNSPVFPGPLTDTFAIPAPTTALLFGTVLAALALPRRRSKAEV